MKTDLEEIQALLARAASITTARDVRPAAISAIRKLEIALIGSISKCGRRLRGAPNLGSRALPIVGYRIRSANPYEKIEFGDGAKHLILSDDGVLTLIKVVDTLDPYPSQPWHAIVGAAIDEDLRIEDVEHVIRVVKLALEAHLATAEATGETFAGLGELAEKLNEIL